jgi:type I restriction enzyme R subunit
LGDYIDKYTIAQSVADGSTVQIIYEGKTAEGEVSDARGLDRLFEDMFQDRMPEELEAIKRKYATTGHVLEAPKLIAAKAEDMLAHYVANVLPNGFKAQAVATSRLAAVRYCRAFRQAHADLLARLDALDPALLALDEEAREALDAETRFLLTAKAHEATIRRLEFATIISGASTDCADWREFTDPAKQEALIGPNGRFKKPLVHDDANKQDGLAFIIVKSMLLTGFDAPVEQVLYLDRSMRGAELLQAVARVNRTHQGKRCGYVVDYFGVARHLTEALAVYTEDDIQGAQVSIRDELPRLEDRHRRVLALFHEHGIPDIADIDACVYALRDPRLRADFQVRLDRFLESMDIVLPRPEALPYVADMKRLGFIQKSAANLYRDGGLNLVGVGGKVRQLIDEHIAARGIDPKIPPISIFDAEFEQYVEGRPSVRSQALEMEHAARHHISQHYQQDPAFYQKLSQRLDAILAAYRDQWEELAEELRRFTRELRAGRQQDETGLDPETQAPFLDLLLGGAERSAVDMDRFCAATVEIVAHFQHELRLVDFWRNVHAQKVLRGWLINYLDERDLLPFEQQEAVADQVIELAEHRHAQLVAAGERP